ncbi:MAG: sigma-70 family RNA polymerase sigma factor [Anaeromyxobacter sp.]
MSMTDAARPGLPPALLEGRRRFLAFLARRLGSEAAAEEVLQGAYVRALESAPATFDEEGAVRWFFRVLRNALIDRARRTDSEQRALSADAAEAPQALDPEWERAVCGCIESALAGVKDDYAILVRRVDLEGASVSDVARQVGVTPNNASVRLHRARRALRERLEGLCGACAAHGCLDCSCRGGPTLGYVPR